MVELSHYVPVNLICLAVLGALGLRKVIRMESYHWLRVILLTGLLWVSALYLFALAYAAPDYDRYSCTPDEQARGVFCISEY